MAEGPAPTTRLPATGPDGTAEPSEGDKARRAQFLATEHWSLLATRSMSWNEAFSRTSMFLSTLSAATVALALAGPAMGFASVFPLFAMIVLSVTLFLGVATYVRLIQVNNEDLLWVFGMNKLRGAYTRLVPGIEDDFISGWTPDFRGVARSIGAIDIAKASPLHAFVTTPAIVAVIASAIAGIIGGLVSVQIGLEMGIASIAGVIIFVVACALMLLYGLREYNKHLRIMAREYNIPLETTTSDTHVSSR
jgi:hypothetical protein